MSSAIIGFGAVGQALARAFARKNLQVAVAARRPPEAIAPQATAIGPTVTAHSLQDALRAEIVILAVPFGLQDELAQAADWHGKIVIDATNAYGVSLDELGGLPSSVVNAQALAGSRLVKAFNHLPARTLAQDPNVKGGRRVTFLSSDDDGAALQVAALVEQLGFAPRQPRQARRGRFTRPGARAHLGSADLPGFGQVRLARSRGGVTTRPTSVSNNVRFPDAGKSI